MYQLIIKKRSEFMEDNQDQPLDYSEDHIVDHKKVSPRPTAFRWGLYGGLAAIVLGLVMHLAGLYDWTKTGGGTIPSIITYGVWIATIVMAIRAHKMEDLGGYIPFGRAFFTGLLTGLMYALITAVWAYIFFSFIAPEALDIIKEAQYDKMAERGMDDAQIEAAEGMMGTFTSPAFLSLTSFISITIMSAIISLIAGAILKKNAPYA